MPKKRSPFLLICNLTVIWLFLTTGGCKQEVIFLSGAGSSLPEPLYKKMFTEYESLKPLQITYYAVGSEVGVKQLKERNIDFGCTDMLDTEGFAAGVQSPEEVLVSLPVCTGAVAITYNLPGNPRLYLTSELLAAIFMGEIVSWNDSRLQEYNRHVELPAKKIQVFYRLEGSGTTHIFSHFLARTSQAWAAGMGQGKILYWKTGSGCQGNTGLAMEVVKREYSIGYVGLYHAMVKGLPAAAIRNKAGNFVEPTPATLMAALEGLADEEGVTGETAGLSFADTSAPTGYPLSGFTYLLLYREQKYSSRKKQQAQALCELVWWMIHDGQQYVEELYFVKLPRLVVTRAEGSLKTITYDNQILLNFTDRRFTDNAVKTSDSALKIKLSDRTCSGEIQLCRN